MKLSNSVILPADQKSLQNWDSTVAYQKSLVECWQIVNHEWMSECCWTSSSAFLKVAMWIELMTLVTWRNRITSSWCTLKNDSFGFLNNFFESRKTVTVRKVRVISSAEKGDVIIFEFVLQIFKRRRLKRRNWLKIVQFYAKLGIPLLLQKNAVKLIKINLTEKKCWQSRKDHSSDPQIIWNFHL